MAKGDGCEDAAVAVRQGILLQIGPLEGWQAGPGKDQQLHHRDDGDDQLKGSGSFYAIDVEGGKDQISYNGNRNDRHGRDKQIQIRSDGKGNGRRRKDELNVLRHAADEAPVLTQRPHRIVKGSARFRDRTGQLGITKGKGQVHENDKTGSDCEAQGAALFQPQVPPKIHARNDVTYAQPPEHQGAESSLQLRLFVAHPS